MAGSNTCVCTGMPALLSRSLDASNSPPRVPRVVFPAAASATASSPWPRLRFRLASAAALIAAGTGAAGTGAAGVAAEEVQAQPQSLVSPAPPGYVLPPRPPAAPVGAGAGWLALRPVALRAGQQRPPPNAVSVIDNVAPLSAGYRFHSGTTPTEPPSPDGDARPLAVAGVCTYPACALSLPVLTRLQNRKRHHRGLPPHLLPRPRLQSQPRTRNTNISRFSQHGVQTT
jgi:hypothetical protein